MQISTKVLCLLLCLARVASAQTATKELDAGYYVVVGAYTPAKEENAKRFTTSLVQRGYQADYGFNSSRNLFYVYINYFDNLKESIRKMQRVRASKKFVDAWVRVVPGDIKMKETNVVSSVSKSQDKPILTADSTNTNSDSTSNADDVIFNEAIKQYPIMTLGNTEVFLSLYNVAHNRIVDGEVQVFDKEHSRAMTRVKGNEYLTLPDPKSNSGGLTLECEVFGYRKVQCEINYAKPLADTVKPNIDLWGTTIVINFNLVRYKMGDVATLNGVSFYNESAIMMPESKNELDAFVQMMRENPNYKVTLHGHTNGNYHGKIISVGPAKNFFSLTGAKESAGSAKDLSEKRAEIIKDYLVTNGINEERITVEAWGGKKPLYDKQSVNAGKNVRVEVEIKAE